ncbi:hypothetical protein BX600DRAFT_530290 [Xylariales sp. PMI_506]|nr:hypothetical protein BX600DRAFT_530290 [Xylariales sp. PMI_506]
MGAASQACGVVGRLLNGLWAYGVLSAVATICLQLRASLLFYALAIYETRVTGMSHHSLYTSSDPTEYSVSHEHSGLMLLLASSRTLGIRNAKPPMTFVTSIRMQGSPSRAIMIMQSMQGVAVLAIRHFRDCGEAFNLRPGSPAEHHLVGHGKRTQPNRK